jgi:hypothetical protein
MSEGKVVRGGVGVGAATQWRPERREGGSHMARQGFGGRWQLHRNNQARREAGREETALRGGDPSKPTRPSAASQSARRRRCETRLAETLSSEQERSAKDRRGWGSSTSQLAGDGGHAADGHAKASIVSLRRLGLAYAKRRKCTLGNRSNDGPPIRSGPECR